MHLPLHIVLDASQFEPYRRRLEVSEAIFERVLEMLLDTHAEGMYTSGVWEIIEAEIDIGRMSHIQMRNTNADISELCKDLDTYIKNILGAASSEYRYYNWLSPWAAVFKRKI